MLKLLDHVNDDIWYPGTQIAFSSAIETGIPIIPDPSPNDGSPKGDLAVAFLSGEPITAAAACEEVWNSRFPGSKGFPVVTARKFINSGFTLGVTPGPDTGLAEDKNVVFKSCAENRSLMFPSASCPNLQPLQVETARGVALVMPGAKDGMPPVVNSQ